jgi:DNA-binding NarL/FixJ family response regulator
VSRPRLLLADDHSLVIAGFKKLLEPEFEVVATVEDGRALVSRAVELEPDVILLDISMPLLNGLEAARQLHKLRPGIKLIFVTVHSEPDYAAEAFRAGASGYILKRSAATELVAAIRAVLSGRTYITSLISTTGLGPSPAEPASALTPRQREVLQLVAEGKSAKQIASILNISLKTVEFHKGVIMNKLRLHSVAELTKYAIEHKITSI